MTDKVCDMCRGQLVKKDSINSGNSIYVTYSCSTCGKTSCICSGLNAERAIWFMNEKQINELRKKGREELVQTIIDLDKKLFNLIKELSTSQEYKGIVLDKSLNDFFAQKIIDEERSKWSRLRLLNSDDFKFFNTLFFDVLNESFFGIWVPETIFCQRNHSGILLITFSVVR